MIEQEDRQDGFRIAVFGNRGYMSVILTNLLNTNHSVVVVCANEPAGLKSHFRSKVGRFLRRIGLRKDRDFFYEDPFAGLDEPVRLARKNNIPTLLPEDLHTSEFAKAISMAKPDIVIVAGFHRKIPKSVFDLAENMAVNFHPSLLPAHRGGTPNRWVVFAGEDHTGVTVHHLSPEFDAGAILFSEEVPISAGDCWGDVEKHILARLPRVLNRLLDLCATGQKSGTLQTEGDATYEPSFRGRHAQADWNDSPQIFLRRCLALRPKTGVRTSYGGEPLCFWEVGTGPDETGGVPGEIIGFDTYNNPIVRCGTQATLTILQTLSGGRLVSGRQMAGQMNFKVGGRFD